MNLSPAPIRNPIINNDLLPVDDESKNVIAAWLTPRVWVQWFNALAQSINLMPQLTSMGASSVSLVSQGASIATTVLGSTNSAGMYRINRYLQVTRAATTSSSIYISITWTYKGQTFTNSTSALTGNSLVTRISTLETIFSFMVDEGTAISYSTTYASVGATSMLYDMAIRLEQLP